MKKKVLISIVGIALFAIAVAFNTNTESNQQQKEANVEAINEANAAKKDDSFEIRHTRCMRWNGLCSLTDAPRWHGYM